MMMTSTLSEQDFKRPQIVKTRDLKIPNYYTQAIDGEFAAYSLSEERAPRFKSQWRKEVFQSVYNSFVDVEIGTGNGVHFQHFCRSNPGRYLVGIELKYKPLIQSIRAMLRTGQTNGRICRYHAFNIDELFDIEEVNDIYIHFPDPWTSPRKPKNRILNPRMLDVLWNLQRPGSKLDFKTDSQEMFLWSMENVKQSQYQIEYMTLDLHRSPYSVENVITGFERIFLRQGLPICFARLRKP